MVQSLPRSSGVIPEVYLLEELNPDDSILERRPDDDFICWVWEKEEEDSLAALSDQYRKSSRVLRIYPDFPYQSPVERTHP